MALRKKDKEQLLGIADNLDAAIAGIFAEQEQIAQLSDARSVQKRQAVISQHISNISTQSNTLRAAVDEMSAQKPKPSEGTPEMPPEEVTDGDGN